MRNAPLAIALAACSMAPAGPRDEGASGDGWSRLDAAARERVLARAQDYRAFLAAARTEITTIAQARERARGAGFGLLEWTGDEPLPGAPGARFFVGNRDRAAILVVRGRRPVSEGVRLVGTHIDSPRLDLKGNPLYDGEGFALLQTNPHGGIKKYQWANVPLALLGRVVGPDGKSVDVSVGLDPRDPVLVIPDAAPHEDRELRDRTYEKVLRGEELDPVVGSIGEEGKKVKEAIAATLRERYGLDAAGFAAAELSLVPATEPRDVGIDGSMVGGYGQDDRLCSYAGLAALLEFEGTPSRTCLLFLSDNEETGSGNNTGAASSFLRDLLAALAGRDVAADPLRLARTLNRVEAISADVTTGVNPIFPSAQEGTNAAKLGRGVALKRYGRGSDANAEFSRRVLAILEEAKVPWQLQTYKVDVGGGDTIGGFLSAEGMEVVDLGVPILSMHSPFEISSKVDLHFLVEALSAFYRTP
jgi:aspartyl aminopeptidase